MKKVISTLIIFLCIPVFATGQQIHYNKERQQIHITNNEDYTYRYSIMTKTGEKYSVCLSPSQSMSYSMGNTEKEIKKHFVRKQYDEECFDNDIKRILKEYEKLYEKQRFNAILTALFNAADYRFTGGLISDIMSGANKILEVYKEEKSIEDAVADILIDKLTGETIKLLDDKNQETLAVFLISLSKFERSEIRSSRLVALENECIRKLNSRETFDLDLKKYLKKNITYKFSIAASVPVSKSYKVEQNRDLSYAKYGDYLPFDIRLKNEFKLWQVSVAYGQSPILYKAEAVEETLFSNSQAVSFNYIDVGVGINYSLPIKPLLEMGVRNFFINHFSYDGYDNSSINFNKTSSFKHYKSNLYINVGYVFDFKYVELVAYYSFSGKKDNVWSSQVQVGLSIPLVKKYRYN